MGEVELDLPIMLPKKDIERGVSWSGVEKRSSVFPAHTQQFHGAYIRKMDKTYTKHTC